MSHSFQPKQGLIIVPVRVWGPKGNTWVKLALDTGASQTMINWELLVFLGYDPAWALGLSQIGERKWNNDDVAFTNFATPYPLQAAANL